MPRLSCWQPKHCRLQACRSSLSAWGHVDFINGLAEEAGFNAAQLQQLKDCLRRHDAVGMQQMADAMENIRPEIKQLFADFLFLQGGIEILDKVAAIVTNAKCQGALNDLRKIYKLVDAYGAAGYLSFDLGLYRSLDYYTGMLFEVYLPEMGYPVAGGGRYDKMMQRFGLECPGNRLCRWRGPRTAGFGAQRRYYQ